MKAIKNFGLILMLSIGLTAISQPGSYYPPPSSVIFHNDTLTIYPPDSLPGEPIVLLGYNIYVDSVFFDNVFVSNPGETIDFIFGFPALPPGNHAFCVDAVYNEWISENTCDSAVVLYGFDLPFLEDWSSGNFEEQQWTSSTGNWVIEDNDGNPAPAAEFRRDPVQTEYTMALESFPINGNGLTIGRIWLDYNIRLDAINVTGNERLQGQIWNWANKTWIRFIEYSNVAGSFNWKSEHINLSYYAKNKVFRIRFLAEGENSSDIQAWVIDNIHIYRKCDGPSDLEVYEHMEYNELYWDTPTGCGPYWWLQWDDGENSGNSIGTGGAVEFDVAARWTPAQLDDYAGYPITQIAFFPAEAYANYRARLWIGGGPDTMLLDEPLLSPVINQWNYFTLPNPIQLDVTQDLWVGYNIVTPTGYPAGVDDGPEIDGSGNMIYFDSTWSTLIELNPELEYNWNIACRLGPHGDDPLGYYNIYRKTNNDGFILIDSTDDWGYFDYNINLPDYYCYKVSIQWYTTNGDSCETAPTNIACENIMLGTGKQEQAQNIRVYPNPVNDLLNIEAEEAIREVRLYNPLGEMVLKMEIGNSVGQIDVSCLQGGIYFVEVVTEKMNYKDKILIFR